MLAECGVNGGRFARIVREEPNGDEWRDVIGLLPRQIPVPVTGAPADGQFLVGVFRAFDVGGGRVFSGRRSPG